MALTSPLGARNASKAQVFYESGPGSPLANQDRNACQGDSSPARGAEGQRKAELPTRIILWKA